MHLVVESTLVTETHSFFIVILLYCNLDRFFLSKRIGF
jgi:hypothetical protein